MKIGRLYVLPVGCLLFLLGLLMPGQAFPLDASAYRQLLVSVTEGWDDSSATVYRFRRADDGWVRSGPAIRAEVGERGLGWDPSVPSRDVRDPVKKEGDRRAPAGIFPLSRAMGFSPAPPAGSEFPYRPITVGTHCVDDGASPYYNRIVDDSALPPTSRLWKSSERMWELPDLYRLLVVVDYNVRESKPGNGSCIFMHVWRGPGTPTSGCTAMAGSDMEEIVRWLDPARDPALVQLPRDTYKKVWREWRLPSPVQIEKEKDDLVDVVSVVPGIAVDMRYARPDNFTGKAVYDCLRCFVRRGTAEKVAAAQRELQSMGLSLKMWDCYRPLSVQKLFWSLVPDSRYVADPKTGSRHNRGTAVDVTLVDAAGRDLEMPTKFDDFSPRAAHSAADVPAVARENRRLLAAVMEKAGFTKLSSEWWHYDETGQDTQLLDIPFRELCSQ